MLGLLMLMALDDEDRQIIDYIYRKYGDYMYKVAFSLTQNEMDALEIISDVFYSLMKLKSMPNNIDKLKPFLFCVIKAKYINNKLKAQNSVDYLNFRDNVFLTPKPQADLERKELSEKLSREILNMSPLYRYVLYLRLYEEYSVKDIAILLSVKESIVERVLKKGTEILLSKKERYERDGSF